VNVHRIPPALIGLSAAGLAGAGALAAFRVLSFAPEALPTLLLGAVVAVALAARPSWVLPAFIALTWTGIDAGDVSGLPSPVELGAAGLFVVACWYALTQRALSTDVALVCVFLALPLVAAGLVSPTGGAIPGDGLKELSFFFIVAICIRNVEAVDRSVAALVCVGIFLSLGAVYSVLVHPTGLFPLNEIRPGVVSPEAPRAAGPFGEANFFALSLATLVPMALYLLVKQGPTRLLGFAGGAALAAGLMATGSRGGLLAGTVAAIVFAIVSGVGRLRVASVAVVLVGAALLPIFSEQASGASERSIEGRQTENAVAAAMFLDRPLTGVGPGQYNPLYRDYARRVGNDPRPLRDPHSLLLELAAELGLAGLIGWLGALAVVVAYARRTRVWATLLGRALVVSTFAYLVASLFLHGERLRLLFILVALLMALGSAIRASREERPA
jgi:O-antigen ligase